jgi:peptidylprolyl isomerase
MSAFDTTGYVDVSGDGGLLKKILAEGDGASPQPGDEVVAHYTGTLDDGTVFDSSRERGQTFKFTIGRGQVIKGWDQGFAAMRKGEKAILRCRSDYAYGKGGQGKIPPNATLNFDVELISFGPKKKESWEKSDEEKIAEGTALKDKGNKHYSAKEYQEAVEAYEEAAGIADGSHNPVLEALFITCKLNSAQANIGAGRYSEAVTLASEALKKDADNLKGLYRRGLARNHLGLAEEALEDLYRLQELDPENKAAKVEIAKAKKAIQDAKKKTKAAYGNFFSKLSVYDDKEAPLIPGSNSSNPKVNKFPYFYQAFISPLLRT